MPISQAAERYSRFQRDLARAALAATWANASVDDLDSKVGQPAVVATRSGAVYTIYFGVLARQQLRIGQNGFIEGH